MTAPVPPPVAVHATAAALPAVSGAVAASFADDPVMQWLFEPSTDPDDARGRFFRFFTEEYFGLGHVYLVAVDGAHGAGGAALWEPPDRHILGGGRVEELIALVTDLLGDEAMPRLTELGRAAEHRPPEPHFYLGILGVAPDHQGRGLGGALVAPVLDACDRGGFVAHLESSNPRNLGFYERLGFVATDEYRVGPATGPLLTVMRRTPS